MAIADWRHDCIARWTKDGLIPPLTRRVIIDISMEDAIKVYTEAYAEEAMLDVDLTAALRGADIITATAKAENAST